MLPSQRGLKLASLNINKLITHIDELRILLAHNEIYILSINETKLNETIADNWPFSHQRRIIRMDGSSVWLIFRLGVNSRRIIVEFSRLEFTLDG